MPTRPAAQRFRDPEYASRLESSLPVPAGAADLDFFNDLQRNSELLGRVFKYAGEASSEVKSAGGTSTLDLWNTYKDMIGNYSKWIKDLMQPYLGKTVEEIKDPAFKAFPQGHIFDSQIYDKPYTIGQMRNMFATMEGTLHSILSNFEEVSRGK